MDSFIDREYEHPEDDATPALSLDGRFFRMLGASLALHVTLSALLLAGGARNGGTPQAPLVDLAMVQPAAPSAPTPPAMTVPAAPAITTPPPDPAAATTPPPPAAPAAATEASSPLTRTSFGLGISRGYFRSLGDGHSLRPEVRDYYFTMLEKINQNWWTYSAALRDGIPQEPVINVWVGRNGEIIRRELLQSSGSAACDRAIMQAVDASSPLPALPAGFSAEVFEAPVRLVTPRGLMVDSTNRF